MDLSSILQNRDTSDVKFRFETETGVKLELPAHKLVLACASEVFMAQFYGELKEEKSTIDVLDASYAAFKVFLDYVYNIEVPGETMSAEFVVEVYNLAQKFLMVGLQDFLIGELVLRIYSGEFKLLDVAKLAEQTTYFEKLSNALYEAGIKVIREDVEVVFEMAEEGAQETEERAKNSETVYKLLVKGKKAKKVEGEKKLFCINCLNSKCLNGEVLTMENYVLNAKVNIKRGLEDCRESKVLEMREDVNVRLLGENWDLLSNWEIKYKC